MFISPGAEWCEHKAQMGHWFDAQPGQNAQPSVSSIYRSKLFKLRCWAAFFYNLNLFGGPTSMLLLFAEMLMRRRLSWRLCLSNSAFIWSPRFKFWQDARTLLQKAIDEGKACCLASRILISCCLTRYTPTKNTKTHHMQVSRALIDNCETAKKALETACEPLKMKKAKKWEVWAPLEMMMSFAT